MRLGKGRFALIRNTIVLSKQFAMVFAAGSKADIRCNIVAHNYRGVWFVEGAKPVFAENVFHGHLIANGFQRFDINFVRQAWLPGMGARIFR